MTTQPTSAVRYGDRRMSFTMQPCGKDGHPVNHGMSYADAHSLNDARNYAERVLTAGKIMNWDVYSVQVTGQVYEFQGHAWVPVTGAAANYEAYTFYAFTVVTDQRTFTLVVVDGAYTTSDVDAQLSPGETVTSITLKGTERISARDLQEGDTIHGIDTGVAGIVYARGPFRIVGRPSIARDHRTVNFRTNSRTSGLMQLGGDDTAYIAPRTW